jgi:hypothetical protein
MKHTLFLIAALTALSACMPLTIYHKTGVEVTRMERDRTDCAVRALNAAPVATQVRQTPPVFVPARQVCNSAGVCTVIPGYWEPGHIYTVDPNEGLRARVQDQCMADRGYAPVSIPACPAGIRNAAPVQASTRLPAITPRSCVIRYDDGSWQIVTRG